MGLNISDEYFGELLPFIKDEYVTDITWNGRDLWLDDLRKGRYKSDIKLSKQFVNTFSTRIANLANKNFNLSEPLLEAETDNLRISIVDDTVTNTNRSIAIRKTPAVRRLNELKMLDDGYAEAMVLKLLRALVRGHSSMIVTGDVGSGKTELVKYLTKFIPPYERTISIEDNYELRLSSINPRLDCVEIKASQDGPFSYQMAIKAALRQLCKWLLMAEARSKEVVQLLEAASTGCIVMTTLHSDDVRKIPDRVVNMMGMEGEEKRNDVYNFFDVGIKVGIQKTDKGIKRSIDQICVMDRDDNKNELYLIYNKGFTGTTLPRNLWQKVVQGAKDEISLFEFLKPENADVVNLSETPEFADQMTDLEKQMRESLIRESEDEELMEKYGATDVLGVDDIARWLDSDEAEETVSLDDLVEEIDSAEQETSLEDLFGSDVDEEQFAAPEALDDALFEIEEDERRERERIEEERRKEEEARLAEEAAIRAEEERIEAERLAEEMRLEEERQAAEEYEKMREAAKIAAREKYDAEIEEARLAYEAELRRVEDEQAISLDDLFPDEEDAFNIDDLFEDDLLDEIEEINEEPQAESSFSIDDLLSSNEIPMLKMLNEENVDSLIGLFPELEVEKGMSREELVAKLKQLITLNWFKSLSEEELATELQRAVQLAEDCNKQGVPIPEEEMLKINIMLGGLR